MEKNTLNYDNWNANLYDSGHSFVSKFGEGVVELLAPKKGEFILDLGCGTGDLTNKIQELGAHVVGIDQSENMVQQAQHKYKDISFQVGDAIQLEYQNEFDAVFSNAVLHWIKTPKQALQGIYNSLKQGGRFIAEFGGKDNVQHITQELYAQLQSAGIELTDERYPWYYPSIGEYALLMEKVGFRVTYAVHFDRPTPLKGEEGLRNWLKMFTGSMFTEVDSETKESIVAKVEENLRKDLYKEGEWVADYKRLRVVGVKE
ncbi:methyltransferase domain-containing protein [bacterium LRH843]|nr:methyltransferase domain-containing protein [bacterium LRH843]